MYALAITVNATFGFAFTFKNDTSNGRYDFVVAGKGEATIEQKVTSEVAYASSTKDQKCNAINFTPWLLGK